MAPHQKSRSLKGTLIGVVFIMLGIVACTLSLVAIIDWRCRADIDFWLPVYPNSEILVMQQTGFFRPRASGVTEIVYVTPDEPAVVRRWYTDYRREITRNLNNESNPDSAARGMATTSYRVIENPDGAGSRILHLSECAYN